MDLINVVEPLYSNEKEQLQEQISVLALANSSIVMTMNTQRINECKIMNDYIREAKADHTFILWVSFSG